MSVRPGSHGQERPCLDVETAAALVDQRLHTDEMDRAEQHLDGCQTCREIVADLAAMLAMDDAREMTS